MPEPTTRSSLFLGRAVTSLLVIGPAIAIGIVVPLLWGHAIHLRDVLLAVFFYFFTGFGVTVGFHRLFTHRSFKANRALKIFLGCAGSMALEGSLTGWVANHRRHHQFSDEDGDPHSPHRFGDGPWGQLRGFFHAHIGWLFVGDPTSAERYAPDMLKDPDTKLIGQLFPVFAIFSLIAPFFLGWGISGRVEGAVTALIWAGVARMVLLHHVTWSVNSVCHIWGKRPNETSDRSTNFAPMAIISMGESWHNYHHAHPASARHGAFKHQIDPSAAVIRIFERAGWATKVRWPSAVDLVADEAA
jgi:stearoyl-CoA desaturase (delta-9 desaturase)